ncbi:MAG: divergent polysaccharide deacetylase family protein [Parahaliea sp.]
MTRGPDKCPHLYFDSEPPVVMPAVVIIIDDIGNQLANSRAAIELPGKLNYAILPYTPYGSRLAHQAHQLGKEVLLHAPMSNISNMPLGRGALTPALSHQQFNDTLRASLASIPFVRGVNNHMGSALTQRHTQMRWLMVELARQHLYFVDSRTDKRTVAAHIAREQYVPNLSRQIFLDNQQNHDAIAKQFQHLLQLARNRGMAVGIGHPYPQTIAFLEEALPKLKRQGFRLALVSEVIE